MRAHHFAVLAIRHQGAVFGRWGGDVVESENSVTQRSKITVPLTAFRHSPRRLHDLGDCEAATIVHSRPQVLEPNNQAYSYCYRSVRTRCT